MGKISRKAKTPQGEFKVTTSKNLLISNQVVTCMKNLPLLWTIVKYQPTVEPFYKSPIGLVIVEGFFACIDPSM